MENLSEIAESYRGWLINKGDLVLDIGASEGYFTNYAKSKGAEVMSFDARNDLAIGPNDGVCEVKGEGLGAYIIPNQGLVKMVSLKSVLDSIDQEIDFLKCDIEGGEYLIFNCDLSKIKFIAIEFHVWTKEGEPKVEGLGVKEIPMPKNAVNKLIKQLEITHKVELVGDNEAGGYIYALRTL